MLVSHLLYISFGGALGTASRFLVSRFFADAKLINTLPAFFTYVTFVNVVGSFLMGLLFAWFSKNNLSGNLENLKMFLTLGFLGGFTTFSAFSLDVFNLIQRGKVTEAAIYIVLSVSLSIILIFLGYYLGSK